MTETAVNTRTCKALVKDDTGGTHACGTNLPKGSPECPNKQRHMHKMRTGFCSDGHCEGTVSKYKTCEFWQLCPCKCHTDIDKMFLLTGQTRVLADNPKYVRPKSIYVMPEVSTTFDPIPVPTNNVPLESGHRHFAPTPSGKRARGQLEQQVLEICEQFTKGLIEVEDLTPHVIAENIDEVEPPSVGAIGAVFDRWVALGFARCEKKPVRFVSFTVDGLMYGLDHLKAKAKQANKMKQAADNRGSLRRR